MDARGLSHYRTVCVFTVYLTLRTTLTISQVSLHSNCATQSRGHSAVLLLHSCRQTCDWDHARQRRKGRYSTDLFCRAPWLQKKCPSLGNCSLCTSYRADFIRKLLRWCPKYCPFKDARPHKPILMTPAQIYRLKLRVPTASSNCTIGCLHSPAIHTTRKRSACSERLGCGRFAFSQAMWLASSFYNNFALFVLSIPKPNFAAHVCDVFTFKLRWREIWNWSDSHWLIVYLTLQLDMLRRIPLHVLLDKHKSYLFAKSYWGNASARHCKEVLKQIWSFAWWGSAPILGLF